MAELKKKQGNYNEYFSYFNKAASNENIFQDTREKLKKEEARRLRLSEFPTADKSPILRIEQGELDNWWRTPIYNVNVPKEEAGQVIVKLAHELKTVKTHADKDRWLMFHKIWEKQYLKAFQEKNVAGGYAHRKLRSVRQCPLRSCCDCTELYESL